MNLPAPLVVPELEIGVPSETSTVGELSPNMTVVDSPPAGDPVVESSGLELPGAGDVPSENCAVDIPEGDDPIDSGEEPSVTCVIDIPIGDDPSVLSVAGSPLALSEELATPAGDVPIDGEEPIDTSVVSVAGEPLNGVSIVTGEDPLSDVAGEASLTSVCDVAGEPLNGVSIVTGEDALSDVPDVTGEASLTSVCDVAGEDSVSGLIVPTELDNMSDSVVPPLTGEFPSVFSVAPDDETPPSGLDAVCAMVLSTVRDCRV